MEEGVHKHFEEGFTRLPNKILYALTSLDINMREVKVLLLILRLTYGCMNKPWAKLKQSDLRAIGISPSHAKEVLESLIEKNFLIQNGSLKEYKINEDVLIAKTRKRKDQLNLLGELVGNQLKKYTSPKGNQKLPKEETPNFPKWENNTSQNGDFYTFPKREVLASRDGDFTGLKDMINISKKSDRKEIADNNTFLDNDFSSIEEKTTAGVYPGEYQPQTEEEVAALAAWNYIEPDNPKSFDFYLYAVSKGLPAGKFYEFAAEIKQDNTIRDKGKVFTTKVTNYLNRKDRSNC